MEQYITVTGKYGGSTQLVNELMNGVAIQNVDDIAFLEYEYEVDNYGGVSELFYLSSLSEHSVYIHI